MSDKRIAIGDIFTDTELNKAQRMYRESKRSGYTGGSMHDRFHDEIVVPVMPRINEKTAQENDSHYMAYMLEYAVSSVGG